MAGGALEEKEEEEVPGTIQLMYLASEGDVEGIGEVLDAGTDVNYQDVDGRTALHVAACQGFDGVVELLLRRGARVEPQDRWGSTPLADAIHYKNHNIVKLLEKYGAKVKIAPMLVKNVYEVPEYEVDPKELDFTNSALITKGTFRIASWRGTQVAVKRLSDDVFFDERKVKAFRDELALLQKLRHPNVVQFLGAVTQSSPMMIITEYLPEGDLRELLRKAGALKPAEALYYALDIARGMNYLHEHKPAAVIHRDLEPSNILLDDSGHLKVADFGVSKSLEITKTMREDTPVSFQESSGRYVAPEVYLNEDYDTKVDVFSFALILQEMIEGCPPLHEKQDYEVAESFVRGQRPPFRASRKLYSCGLKRLIEECWSENPMVRPTFQVIIERIFTIQSCLDRKRLWEALPSKCLQCCQSFWNDESSETSSDTTHSHT